MARRTFKSVIANYKFIPTWPENSWESLLNWGYCTCHICLFSLCIKSIRKRLRPVVCLCSNFLLVTDDVTFCSNCRTSSAKNQLDEAFFSPVINRKPSWHFWDFYFIKSELNNKYKQQFTSYNNLPICKWKMMSSNHKFFVVYLKKSILP